MVKKIGNQYVVLSKTGKRMGQYPTKEEAIKRLRAIEWFKSHPKGRYAKYALKCKLPNLNEEDYILEKDVPVFHNGDKTLADEGNYNHKDLEEIAARTNYRQNTCDLGVIKIGHNTSQQANAPVIGFVKNFRVVNFAKRPTILADLYFRKDKQEAIKDYPRRSAEIIAGEAPYIDCVSVLGSETPARDLSLTFSKKKYSKEINKNMDTKEIVDEVLAALESTGLMDAIKYCAERYESEKGGGEVALDEDKLAGAEEAVATDEEALDGAEEKVLEEPEKKDEYKRKLYQYSKAAQEREAVLNNRVVELERKSRLEERKNNLMQLESEGYDFPDFTAELEDIVDLTPEQYSKYLNKVRMCYRKAPLGISPVRPVQPMKEQTWTYADSVKAADLVTSGKAKTTDEAFRILKGGN